MGFRIEEDESLAESLRRIAIEQVDGAVAEIEDPEFDRHKAVHQARRRMKRLRGILRLEREAFAATYRRDNAFLRDVAQTLAPFRDAQSAIMAFDAFRKRYRDELAGEDLAGIRARLEDVKRETDPGQDELDRRLADTVCSLREFRQRAESWEIEDDGFSTVAGGLERLYAEGVATMAEAYDADEDAPLDPDTTVAFHEWRKRAKYLGFGLRILTPTWKEGVDVYRKAADRIEAKLGEEHDLALLCERVEAEKEAFGLEDEAARFVPLARARRKALRESVRPLGRRFYAEEPEAFVRRLKSYWKTWRKTSRQAGESESAERPAAQA